MPQNFSSTEASPAEPLGEGLTCAWSGDMSIKPLGVHTLYGRSDAAMTGQDNMRVDEALLTTLLSHALPLARESSVLVVRGYGWETPTLSLGKHQPEKDIPPLLQHYTRQLGHTPPVVTRPTGGRAILHGSDYSISFVTNAPELLKLSVSDSYCVFLKWVKAALLRSDYGHLVFPADHVAYEAPRTSENLRPGEEPSVSNRAYVRSPSCFDTVMESDLKDPDGNKRIAFAQTRRRGKTGELHTHGLLQHGSLRLLSATETLTSPTQLQHVMEAGQHVLEQLLQVIEEELSLTRTPWPDNLCL